MTIKGRVGVFFILIGLVILLLYIASLQADQPNFTLLCVALAGLISGVVIAWRSRPPPVSDERFRILRHSQSKQVEDDQQDNQHQL